MKYGLRLVYNKSNGKILNWCLGEMEGSLQQDLRPFEIDYIDLPYGYNDNNFKEAINYYIDTTKDTNTTELRDLIVITEHIQKEETQEEKLRREKEELENQLLLLQDEKTRGLL